MSEMMLGDKEVEDWDYVPDETVIYRIRRHDDYEAGPSTDLYVKKGYFDVGELEIVEPDYEAAEIVLREGLQDDGVLDATAIVDAALKGADNV